MVHCDSLLACVSVTPFTLPNYGLSLIPVNRGIGKYGSVVCTLNEVCPVIRSKAENKVFSE